MPRARINGIDLAYEVHGTGEPVVLVSGTGSPGRVWRTHQVPALKAAGHRVITFDNRGLAPDEPGQRRFTLDDMVADLAGLIEHLGAGPCRVVGHSLGGILVQELLVARPELVRQAVLIASGGRTDEVVRAMAAADLALADSGITLPPVYAAFVTALQNLSPRTLNDGALLRDWLTVFELLGVDPAAVRGQLPVGQIPDRLPAYRTVRRPCLVVAFRDDLVIRPHLSREVADAIPGARYRELADCGHYGHLERPEALNELVLDFFAGREPGVTGGALPVDAAREPVPGRR
ncbi:alpha/beta hydrolase [Streptomyces sp. NPDC002490]|uniref:alpha/beta fold hydrolase n=1 Tax=Streptomyces sp. NPDC002490 TaxID=3154416 RepID=UPI00332479F0